MNKRSLQGHKKPAVLVLANCRKPFREIEMENRLALSIDEISPNLANERLSTQSAAMRQLARARKFGSRRIKVAAKRAMALELLPAEALVLFRASIADYSRWFGAAAVGVRSFA